VIVAASKSSALRLDQHNAASIKHNVERHSMRWRLISINSPRHMQHNSARVITAATMQLIDCSSSAMRGPVEALTHRLTNCSNTP
jgi:hypothetical protein